MNSGDIPAEYQSTSDIKQISNMMKCFSPCIRLYEGLEIFIVMFLSCDCVIRMNNFCVAN